MQELRALFQHKKQARRVKSTKSKNRKAFLKRRVELSEEAFNYVNKARLHIKMHNYRDSIGYKRLLVQFEQAIRKELRRQVKATVAMLNSKGAFKKLDEYRSKKKEEKTEEKIEKASKKIDKKDMAYVDRFFVDWKDKVKPEKMRKVFDYYYKKAGELGGQQALNDLGFKIAFNLKNPDIIERFKERGEKITGDIEESTLDTFREKLYTRYMEEGMSAYDIAEEIDGMFEDTYSGRAMAIARTELGIATSTAQHEAYERNGVERKRWSSTMDDRTRQSHAEANGQTVAIDEPFIITQYDSKGNEIGEVEMMHPLDPDAPPEEVISCRCSEQAIIGETPEEVWAGE